MAVDTKPRCPDARTSWYQDVDLCNLNDKVCLLEAGDRCPYYEEYLEELKKEKNNG